MCLSKQVERCAHVPGNAPGFFLLRRLTLSVLVIAVVAMSSTPSMAQMAGATLRGEIRSPAGPQAGVPVAATHVATGQVRRATSGTDGSYVMVSLRPGTYRVRLGGGEAAQGEELTLRVGQTATLDFDIAAPAPDAAVEEIVVTGTQTKLFEGGALGTSVTPELIDRLPQVNRNFLAFADLAPGVNFIHRSDGSATLRGGVQHQREINVFIDGVSQKDYVLKGGVTGQDTSRGNPFPQSAISEYKIITQNYKAEYPNVASTAITAVTATGTNEFHGSVFWDHTNEDLRAATPLEEMSGEKIDSSQSQYGLNVSGPIIKDKVHYLFAYEAKDNEDPLDVVPGAGFTAATLPAEFAPLAGRQISTFREDLYFGKIDWALSDSQHIEASLKYRDESAVQGFGNALAKSFATSVDQDDTRFQIKHTWITDRWQNELMLTWQDALWSPNPLTSGIGQTLQNSSRQTILRTGAGENFQRKGQKGWGLQEDFTLLDLDWFGSHTIKTGFRYERISLDSLQQLPANPQYFYNVEFNGPGTFELVQPYKVEFGVPLTAASGAVESDNNQYGIFVQDDWYVTDRLTFNIGVRWDYEVTPIYKHQVTPAAVANTLRTWPNIADTNYDIENWISSGDNRDYDSDNIAPRFGFSYELGDSGAHTLYGGYGRSYDRNQFDFLQQEVTNGTFGRVSFLFQGDPDNPCAGTNCVPWDPAFLTEEGLDSLVASTGGEGANAQIFLLNNDLKTPYSDQASIGLRSNWGDWDTDIAYSHVESKDGFNWYLGNRRPDGSFFEPGEIFGAPFGFTPPGFSNLLLSANDLETDADSVYLKIEHPHLENWGVSLAYTYTDGTENRAFDGTFALDYPTIAGYGIEDSVGIATHRVVVTGTYDLPWDILFAGKFAADSGARVQYLDCLRGDGQCVFRRLDPDDADFRQFDISLSKTFNFGFLPEASGFRVRLDVINLFNRRNWTNFDLSPGNLENGPNPAFGRHLDSVDDTRTAKLTFGFNW